MKKLKDCRLSEKIFFWIFRSAYRQPSYNEYGLRFNVDVLNHIHPLLYKWPIEWLAIFVDGVTFEEMKLINTETFAIGGGESLDAHIKNTETLHYNHLNATGLGNYAYIALYHKDQIIKDKAYHLLDECIEEHKKRLEANKQQQ